MNREEALEIINGIERHLANQGMTEEEYSLDEALVTLGVYKQPDPITGLVPCGCKYCDSTHGQRYLYRENKNAPYRGMISTVEITEDDCKKYSQIEGNLYDENGNNFYFVFDIRHCPMCGRELQVAL